MPTSPPEDLVLYVDDDAANRVVFQTHFGRRFHLRVAASAQEALTMLAEQGAAVVLSDQRMPDLSGNELLGRVKALYPDAVRIIVTAHADQDPLLEAVNDGLVWRYIIKPWQPEDVERTITEALAAHQRNRLHAGLQLHLLRTGRLATVGSIASAVLHDLANSLSALDQNSRRLGELAAAAPALAMLLERAGASLAPEAARDLADLAAELPQIVADMLGGCEEMTALTRQLRTLARGSGAVPASTDPAPAIRYALGTCREIALAVRGRLVYDGPESLPPVRLGGGELAHVMVQLVMNAAQALVDGGRRAARVVVTARAREGAVDVVIDDEGPGMPRDVLERVGTPFFTTRRDAAGLGVLQCRRIVEQVGGALRIESAPGRGTRVSVTLPRA